MEGGGRSWRVSPSWRLGPFFDDDDDMHSLAFTISPLLLYVHADM